jgi:prepilin-type N-terminal cleavage/methylation domain-containing protein/prepilin-type processing-associated H-X9-DG protein
MKSNKRAFTLIELLVVIAIIAILAAILFPVFAQAKESAKKSTDISNVKQLSLASIMYSGDYEDVFNPVIMNDHGNNANFTWQMLVYPYTKNLDLFLNPQGNPNSAWNGDPVWKYLGTYGAIPRAGMKNQQYYTVGNANAIARALNVVGVIHNGVMGWGQPVGGTGCWGSCAWVSTPSISQTAVADVANQALIFDAGEMSADYSTSRPVNEELGTCAARLTYSPGGDSIGGITPRWNGGPKSCSEMRGNPPGSRYDMAPGMAEKMLKGQGNVAFTDGHTKSLSASSFYQKESCPTVAGQTCFVHLQLN